MRLLEEYLKSRAVSGKVSFISIITCGSCGKMYDEGALHLCTKKIA